MLKAMVLALFGLVMSLAAFPAAAQTYVEGVHYQRLAQAVKTPDRQKIEVALVFALESPHSFAAEPAVQSWAKRLYRDVQFTRVHGMWSPATEPLARGYYTSSALKVSDAALTQAYNTLHLSHGSLRSAEDWANLLAANGVPKEAAISTYNSFGVTAELKAAQARVRSFTSTSAPELVVNGQYRITLARAGSIEEMLKIANFLIDKIRQERGTG